ncbi:MAG: hypothetical protein EXR36_01485 [Betaproteobacteria bacterium]|nr:hypothetical protein [Betaproteobacteria bacterium]
MKTARRWALLLAGMASWTCAQAVDLRPVLKAGAEFGGDKLFTLVFTDGSTKNVKAHDGFSLGGGASFLNESKSFEIETTLSYKFHFTNASNGDVTWSRIPLDVMGFYRFSRVRLGGRLICHLSPRAKGSGVASNLDIQFDNAAGLVLQADYLFSGKESGQDIY